MTDTEFERPPGRTKGDRPGDEFQDGHRLRQYPVTPAGSPFISHHITMCDACAEASGRSTQYAAQHWARPQDECSHHQHDSNAMLHGLEDVTEYDQYKDHPEVHGWGKDDFSGRGKDVTLCTSCAEDRRSSGTQMDDYYPITDRHVKPYTNPYTHSTTDPLPHHCDDCGHDLAGGRKEASMSTQTIDPRDFGTQAPRHPGMLAVLAALVNQAAYGGVDEGRYGRPPGQTVQNGNSAYHAPGDPNCTHADSEYNPSGECHGHYNPPHPLQEAIDKHQNYKGVRSHVPIGNNTWVHQDTEGAFHIRHHNTDIMSVAPNGDTTINPSGWHSPTTMKRIHNYLPPGVVVRRNTSRARNAPYRLLHLNGEQHEYHDGISFNVHTGDILPDNHVRPGTLNRPPQARGTGDEPRRRSAPRSRSTYPGGYYDSRPTPHVPYEPPTPMHEQESTHEEIHRQLQQVDRGRPAADDWGGDNAGMNFSHHDLPGEGESFDEWMDRTTAPVKKACPACKGKGDVRAPGPVPEGKNPWEHRQECENCGGEGIVHAKTSKRFDREALTLRYQAGLRFLAFGETKAPEAVDTLRDDICPICGESDSYDGDQCGNCGFLAPPSMFQDPDLDKAKQLDLRGDQQVNPGMAGVADPDAFPDLPPVDPEVVDEEGGVPTGDDEPMDPDDMEDEQEEDEARVEGEVRGLEAGEPEEEVVDEAVAEDEDEPADADEVDEEGNVGGPEDPEAADTHVSQGGEPFTKGPNAPTPEEPMEFGEDQDGEEAEELVAEEEQGQGGPGIAGDSVPDLFCPSCGFGADSAHPTTTPSNPMEPANTGDGAVEGDVCPNCQKATLMSGAAPVA